MSYVGSFWLVKWVFLMIVFGVCGGLVLEGLNGRYYYSWV